MSLVVELLRGAELAEPPDAEKQTTGEFVAQVLAAKQNAVRGRTHEDYLALIKRYVTGTHFARTPVAALTPIVVQEYYNSLQNRDVSGFMVRKLNTALSMCFNQGIAWGVLGRNPCRGVVLPRAVSPEIEVLSAEEAKLFAKTCLANPAEYLVLSFALETGMRPSEYLALRWTDVDLARSHVRVRRSVTFSRSGGFSFHEPKTKGSRRTIQISERLRDLLIEHQSLQQKRKEVLTKKIKAPVGTKKEGVRYERRLSQRRQAKLQLNNLLRHNLVFPSTTGGPNAIRNLGVRQMTEACKTAGVPRRSLYSLRHSCFTLMLAAGTDIKTVSVRAGHSSIHITLQTYIHVLPEMGQKGLDSLTAALYC